MLFSALNFYEITCKKLIVQTINFGKKVAAVFPNLVIFEQLEK